MGFLPTCSDSPSFISDLLFLSIFCSKFIHYKSANPVTVVIEIFRFVYFDHVLHHITTIHVKNAESKCCIEEITESS